MHLYPCIAPTLSNFYRNAVNEAHIKALWEHFQVLGDKDTKSGELFITRGGFQEALGYKDQPNLFLERVFQVFDTDGDTKVRSLHARTETL